MDGPDHVSLFAYDNRTFIVQNFQSKRVNARVSVAGAMRLHDLLTSQIVAPAQGGGRQDEAGRGGRGGLGNDRRRTSFEIAVLAHTFRVFAAE
jgi:hypothetical protein